MPAATAPYGLLPINLIGGQAFAGSTRQIPIGSNSGTSIFFGDVVKLNSSGTLDREANTATATPVGVFLGCTYTDATFGKVFRQYYPANTVASDIVAYVADDPDTLFKAVVLTAGSTTVNSVTRANVGENTSLVVNTGVNATGASRSGVSVTCATTATLPVRIVDVVAETAVNSTNFSEVIVKWNAPNVSGQTVAGGHQYLNPTGV